MSLPSSGTSLAELLIAWESAAEAGREISPEELCADRMELLEDVRSGIARLVALNARLALVESSRSDSSPGDPNELPATGAFVRRRSSTFDDVRALCLEFQNEGELRTRPLREWLDRLPDEARPALLRNLLHLDLKRRRDRGEAPQADEYVGELPEYAAIVRTAFLEATSLPFALSQVVDETRNDGLAASGSPSADLLGDYRLVRELGRGGMGTVYEALHLHKGHRVALKTLPFADARRLHYFKREFRTMAEINHPNLVGLHSLASDGGHWFFTMDLVEGSDFRSYVRPAGTLDEGRLRSALSQLISATLALHGHNVIHRDIKPSNVLATPDGRIVVLDFGLALQEHGDATSEGAGTPAYMAPEQAWGETLGGAVDWYAIGVMLYEALSGRRPFESSSTAEILRRKRLEEAPPLPHLGEELADLRDLSMRLLARNPEMRPDAFEIASKANASGVRNPGGAASTPLVGRRDQLAQLEAAFHRVRDVDEPLVALVLGRSGEGKSTLVEKFLEDLKRQGQTATTLAGRCYDRESVPFKALDSLIDSLANHLRRLSDADAALLMPDDVAFLAALFPVLRRVEIVDRLSKTSPTQLDALQVRARAFQALRSLLKRVSREAPVVLFADDLQWGDDESADFLFQVLVPPEAPRALFIGSFRSDEAETSPFLRRWRQLQRESALASVETNVGPLTLDQCFELAVATVGAETPRLKQLVEEFAEQTGGNALLLTELLSCYDPASESFRALPIHEVVKRKLDRLPSDAEDLLDVVSVSGQALRLEEAADAAGHAATAQATIMHMRSEKLVRLIADDADARVDTYHDKVRESKLATMDPTRRRTLHRRLGETIEQAIGDPDLRQLRDLAQRGEPAAPAVGERAFDLSYHFDAAEDSERAGVYAAIAAERASRQFSQSVAAEQFAIARRRVDPSDRELRFRIAKGEGRALSHMGEYDRALAALEGSTELTDDRLQQAQILGLQAEIAHKQGRIGTGVELYGEALRRLGHWVPRTAAGMALALTKETLLQGIHSLTPRTEGRRLRALSPEEELVVELANRKSIVSYYSNTARMLWTHLKGFNLAESRLPSSGLAYAYGLHPGPAAAIGLCDRGLRYNDRALEIASEQGDLLIQGHCFGMRSMALYTSGRLSEAIESAERGIEFLTKAGDIYVIFIAEYHAAVSYWRRGDVRSAVRLLSAGFERILRHGEQASAAGFVNAWALSTEGYLPLEQLRACFRIDPSDAFSAAHVEMAEGIWHLRFRRFEQAIECLERSWRGARGRLVIVPSTIAPNVWLATALRRYANAIGDSEPSKRDALLRRAVATTKTALWLTRMSFVERPRILREAGLIDIARGRESRGRARLQESLRLAERHGDAYEQALTSIAIGRLEARAEDEPGKARTAAAEAEILRIRSEIVEIMRPRMSPAEAGDVSSEV